MLEDAHALVIGISRYVHAPELRTTQDAQDIAGALADPACCGYPTAAVRVLIDGDATRAAILAALDALAHDTRETSTVFVYYSGHGARATTGGSSSYYIVPVDAAITSRDDLDHTAISNAELTARLRAIPAGRLTVVLDCCRASGMADLQLGDAVAPLAQGRGRVVLAAARDAAYSMPGDRDSTMTGYLIEGLRGAASGVGGVIRICDLFHYVQQHVAAQPLDQRPVFKAELEENYPIAQLHGGAAATFNLPAAPDDLAYDAFLSFSQRDPDDRAWVISTLVPYLEGAGLKLCLEDRDFQIGAAKLDEIDRAVTTSRYTLAVFSPAYLANTWADYQSVLAAYLAADSGEPRFMPLLRKPCKLALHTRMTEALDVSRDPEVPAALQRLALALRQPPRPRLAG
ncbi:MAG TPA: caspase family protein [Kofleriaceae bacterium]|jgi:hypothetical protein|nr:caspase family protein [Kofleriaceae bacterium]